MDQQNIDQFLKFIQQAENDPSSMPLDMTAENNDLTAWPLNLLETLPAFRLLTPPVFKTSAIHYVHTYDSTMTELPVNLLSFGSSTPLYCQTSVS